MKCRCVNAPIFSVYKISFCLFLLLIHGISHADVIAPIRILHLGDSYSAGNGARGPDGERDYVGVETCFRSPTNWGSRFVDSLEGTFSVSLAKTYVNKACSGAVLADIIREDQEVEKIFSGLLESCPTVKFPDQEYWEKDGLSCRRNVKKQIEWVDSSYDLILLTGGGNDAQFGTIVKQCFATGIRDPGSCRDAVDFANEKMVYIENILVEVLGEIRARSEGKARVVLATYPHLVPNVGYQVKSLTGLWEDYNAGDEIRALSRLGDERQRAAVEKANLAAGEEFVFLYDEIKDIFVGHLPNPFQSEGVNPDGWIWEFQNGIGQYAIEGYHYKPLGHENIANAMSLFGSFGASAGDLSTSKSIDLAFVVDTTGSMGGEIAEVRTNMSALVSQLDSSTDSFRVAIVSYRDFSERTGDIADYPFRVDQDFTSDLASIQSGIDSLVASGGGDAEETVFSGINAALNLSWNPGVTKLAIVIGDAPAHSPEEPISGLTIGGIVQKSIAIDPVQVIAVNVAGGYLDSNGALTEIAEGTGGSVVSGAGGLTSTISDIINTASIEPYAWIGVAYSGRTGSPVTFDASGSYDPSGNPLSLYEWDFDGDGVYDVNTTVPEVSHTYISNYSGYVITRVTGSGGTALASARAEVNEFGYALQGDEYSCDVDENGFSIITDESGKTIPCFADNMPTEDKEGVYVIVNGMGIDEALGSLSDVISNITHKAFSNKYREINKAITSGDTEYACESLTGMTSLALAQAGKKITEDESMSIIELSNDIKDYLGC